MSRPADYRNTEKLGTDRMARFRALDVVVETSDIY